MKRIFLFAFSILVLGLSALKADNDRVITKDRLPAEAQKFINEQFASLKISYVKEDTDFLNRNYEVVFADGTKVEFLRNGNWKEIDCRYSEVPSVAVPEQIKKYIAENYPNEKVLQIDRDRHDYEVRLSNRLELTFDKKFNLIDIDD